MSTGERSRRRLRSRKKSRLGLRCLRARMRIHAPVRPVARGCELFNFNSFLANPRGDGSASVIRATRSTRPARYSSSWELIIWSEPDFECKLVASLSAAHLVEHHLVLVDVAIRELERESGQSGDSNESDESGKLTWSACDQSCTLDQLRPPLNQGRTCERRISLRVGGPLAIRASGFLASSRLTGCAKTIGIDEVALCCGFAATKVRPTNGTNRGETRNKLRESEPLDPSSQLWLLVVRFARFGCLFGESGGA